MSLALLAGASASCSTTHEEREQIVHPPNPLDAHDPELGPGEALLKGVVRSETTRAAIADAEVLVQSTGRGATAEQSALTDAKGRFQMIVPAGRCQLFTTKCDYQPEMRELEAGALSPNAVSIFLTPKPGEGCPH